LKEKRLEKGWSQYQLAARAGCTNSNVSYLEKHPELETVEGLAGALGWDINEARRLAGYRESDDDNLTPLEVEDDFRLALHGFKGLSEPGREMVKNRSPGSSTLLVNASGGQAVFHLKTRLRGPPEAASFRK
jgi:transcriptional regulator with XRE-family HTH domain